MSAIEELQTAVNSLDTLLTLSAVFDAPDAPQTMNRLARNARNSILRALDDLDTVPAEVCFDNDAIERMIEAAGVEYRRGIFM